LSMNVFVSKVEVYLNILIGSMVLLLKKFRPQDIKKQ
jgi:hypothetical protein